MYCNIVFYQMCGTNIWEFKSGNWASFKLHCTKCRKKCPCYNNAALIKKNFPDWYCLCHEKYLKIQFKRRKNTSWPIRRSKQRHDVNSPPPPQKKENTIRANNYFIRLLEKNLFKSSCHFSPLFALNNSSVFNLVDKPKENMSTY